MRPLRTALLAIGLLAGAAPSAVAQLSSFNIEVLDQVMLAPPLAVTDVDLDGSLAVVGLGAFGAAIVDVSHAGDLRVLSVFNLPGQLNINDVQAANRRAYLSNAGFNGVAVYILDLTNPSAPVVIGGILQPTMNIAHNVFIDGNILYVIGHAGANYYTYIFNVSNPAAPVLLTVLPTVGSHDITVLDDILYEAGGWSGLHIWDVADPADPVHLAEADLNDGPLPHYHTHSVWPTEDRSHILTMNEITTWEGNGQIQAGALKVWAWDAGVIKQVASWQPDVAIEFPLITIHNAVVRSRYAYVSYYQAGIRVVDVKYPDQPVEVGLYDTYPDLPTTLFQGCWGVDLGTSSGGGQTFYASDRTGGLYQLKFNLSRRAQLAGHVEDAETGAPIAGARVRLVNADRTVTADGAGRFSVLTGEGRHQIDITAPGYIGSSLIHQLRANQQAELDIALHVNDTTEASELGLASPSAASLDLARPNPFHPSAGSVVIPFAVPGGGETDVKLSVHDVTGRAVRVLHDGPLAPGRHMERWDGRSTDGSTLPAAVYFIRLRAGDTQRSGRLEIIR